MGRISKNNLLIYLIIFIIGLAFGLIINDVPYIGLKKEMSVGEIANLIMAIFVAIYIPFYLDKRIQNKRSEKDILIALCDKLDSKIDSINNLVEVEYLNGKVIKKDRADKIILSVQSLSNLLNMAKEGAEGYISNDKRTKNTIELLEGNQHELWFYTTLNLRDKKPLITSDSYVYIEKVQHEYAKNISRLKIYINNS